MSLEYSTDIEKLHRNDGLFQSVLQINYPLTKVQQHIEVIYENSNFGRRLWDAPVGRNRR